MAGGNSEQQQARPLDILFVISGLRVGGTERQLLLLASALAKSGTKVAVYSFLDGPIRQQIARHGVEVVGPSKGLNGPFSIAIAAFALFAFMRRRRPRIAHFFLPAAYLIGAPLAVLARVRVRVMSRRSLNNYQRGIFVRSAERMMHQTMQAVLGNSRSVVSQLRDEGVAAEHLALIYNGIDSARVVSSRGDARAALSLPADSLVMCIVANLIPYKGHTDLIAALAQAAPKLPADWKLLVVGRDDGVGPGLSTQVRDLGLSGHVVFMGAREDVGTILSASDIGLLTSHEEGFSNAILEGMAAGLPMIVTSAGGNAEAVLHEETGIVVPVRDIERLAAAIVRLAGDASLRARLGVAGRERATRHFGVERFVRDHQALYDALLGGRRPIDVPELAS